MTSLPMHGHFSSFNITLTSCNETRNFSEIKTEEYENPLDTQPVLQYFFIFCLALQSVLGTIGNILVMGAVCTMPALRTTGNFFIINLAVADIFVTSVTQPANIVGALRGEKWFQDRPIICSVIGTLCSTGCVSSTWNICMISINRYILISHYEIYHKIYTKGKTLLMCLGVWAMIYAIELPTHLGWGDKRFSVVFFVCTFANHVHSYALFYIGFGVLIPIGASFAAYLGIYLKVRDSTLVHRRISSRSMDKIQSKNERAKQRAKRRMFRENVRVAQALFRVFLIFILMWLPVAILILMGKGTQVPHVWYILTVLLAHGNSSINCVVYAASIDHFREGYYKILGIKRRHHNGFFLSAEKHASAGVSISEPLIAMRGRVSKMLNVNDSVDPEGSLSTSFTSLSTNGSRLLPS